VGWEAGRWANIKNRIKRIVRYNLEKIVVDRAENEGGIW